MEGFIVAVIVIGFVALFFGGAFIKNREFNKDKEEYDKREAQRFAEQTAIKNLEKLERLAKLREQGHLTEEEFEAQKRKLLN